MFGVISAEYTDKGATGGVPALTTTTQVQTRQKRQEVEHVVTQSGTTTATNTDGGAGVHRNSLAIGDWIKLNGPFNLHQIDTVTVRYADNAAGRTVGSPLGAIEVRTGSQTGPIVTTLNLTSTGNTTAWNSLTFPISLAGQERPVPGVPLGHGRRDGQHVPAQLGGVQRQRRDGPEDDAPTAAPAARCPRRCR